MTTDAMALASGDTGQATLPDMEISEKMAARAYNRLLYALDAVGKSPSVHKSVA